MEYTVEVYKKDRRLKEGLRLIEKVDVGAMPIKELDILVRAQEDQGYLVKVRETYVFRTNLMSGETYKERYDTPRVCSPSSESYWSM